MGLTEIHRLDLNKRTQQLHDLCSVPVNGHTTVRPKQQTEDGKCTLYKMLSDLRNSIVFWKVS